MGSVKLMTKIIWNKWADFILIQQPPKWLIAVFLIAGFLMLIFAGFMLYQNTIGTNWVIANATILETSLQENYGGNNGLTWAPVVQYSFEWNRQKLFHTFTGVGFNQRWFVEDFIAQHYTVGKSIEVKVNTVNPNDSKPVLPFWNENGVFVIVAFLGFAMTAMTIYGVIKKR